MLQKRARGLQSFERLMVYVADQIRYTAAPIGEIMQTAPQEAELCALHEVLTDTPANRWQSAFCRWLQTDSHQTGLTPEDVSLLMRWGEGLGTTDIQGQLEHCHRCREELQNALSTAKQEALVKGKLYTTLGAAGGLTVALLWL